MNKEQTAVVLGGYGLIGSACVRALKSAGFRVIGIGRSLSAGHQTAPDIEWLKRDIAATSADAWGADLAGVDVVVNASGALQDGLRDRLRGIHEDALANLIDALSGSEARFIQISAAGVSAQASTEFMRSKWRGDRTLMASNLDWIILRPALVLAPHAYGGTALLRASAAFPAVELKILPDTPIQTVYVEDVAQAVVFAARGETASRTVAELTEGQTHRFQDVVRNIRRWQGFPPWRCCLPIPNPLLRLLGRLSDGLGWLGWRSPLRTTAIRTLEAGLSGNANGSSTADSPPCRSLDATLATLPATAQERCFARMYLMLPLAIATLSLFWIVSGLVGFARFDTAATLLTDRAFLSATAGIAVLGGSTIDILLGLAILIRHWTRRAALGMIAVSFGYLAAAAIWTPALWADPLGPMIKVIPGIALAAIVAAILEPR